MQLFELAINLRAEVKPVESGRQRVTSKAIEPLPTTLQHHSMDHNAFTREGFLILERQGNDVNIVAALGQALRNAVYVVG